MLREKGRYNLRAKCANAIGTIREHENYLAPDRATKAANLTPDNTLLRWQSKMIFHERLRIRAVMSSKSLVDVPTHETRRQNRRFDMWKLCLGAVLALALVSACHAYSVLTHEEIVDLVWKDHIEPLLLNRFPTATEDDLQKARAFAYGGSVIQDMGYYPFGNKYFSDLAHYVRSGDFVESIIANRPTLTSTRSRWARLATTRPITTATPPSIAPLRSNFPNSRKNTVPE